MVLVNTGRMVLKTCLLLGTLPVIFSIEFTHDRKRIGPMNLAMAEHSCLQKFSISENTIIRTQDSRILGAKFLNESDVANREDCLSLCCSTRFCDVAVFQEKSPFPCYLFDCGPPEDFVCKFSTHSYYTSAVLTINRHQLDLGLWSSQHQHEAELSDLRSSPDDLDKQIVQSRVGATGDAEEENTTKMSSITTTTHPMVVTTLSSRTALKTPIGHKCSRFQFPCLSGECIAIYNACDGIPQCKDGSDEGRDLSCPGELSSEQDQKPPPPPHSHSHHDPSASWNAPAAANRRSYADPERPIFNHRGNPNEYIYNSRMNGDASPDFHREDGLGYGGNGKGPGYYDYNQKNLLSNNPYGIGGKQREIANNFPDYGLVHPPRDHPPMNKNLPPSEHNLPQHYNQQQRQQEDLGAKLPPWQGQTSRYLYPPMDENDPAQYDRRSHANDPMYNGAVPPPVSRPAAAAGGGAPSRMQTDDTFIPGNRINLSNGINEGHFHNARRQQIPIISNIHQKTLSDNSPTEVTTGATNAASSSAEAAEGTKDDNKSVATADGDDEAKTDPKKNGPASVSSSSPEEGKKGKKKKKGKVSLKEDVSSSFLAHASVSKFEVDMKELEREDVTQKLQTSGAVLALSLGVCVTGILMVLVVCRIRGLSRKVHRRRRGMKSPLEHDADYLVNGMYL